MIRRALLLVIVAALALASVGCHGSKSSVAFDIPAEFDTSRDYEITFWAKNDSNKRQTDIYRAAIADFEALYPNIKITLRLYTDYGRIYNDVITNITTNTTPNVCITYPDHIATYLTGQNTVVPLDSLLRDEKYGFGGSELRFETPSADGIVRSFLEECSFGGYYYALPFMRSTEACYVNRTFVEALGYTLPDTLTWDFVWEVSEAAMARDADGIFSINGQSVMIPFIYKSTDNMMIQQLRQLGADYSTASGEVRLFGGETKPLLRTIAQHSETRAFSTFKISGYPANFLDAGQCIFAIDSTAGATWMGPNAPLTDIADEKRVDFETAVMPIPQFDASKPQMISQGPSVCVFNKDDPQEVLASWLFTSFLLTDGVQIAYSGTEGYVPVTTDAQASPEYTDYLSRAGEDNDVYYDIKIKASRLLLDNIENTFVTPVFNGSTSLRDAAGQLIEGVVKAVRRNETVDDAFIERLYGEVRSLYRLDQGSLGDAASRGGDVGALPTTARVLIGALVAAWILIALYGAVRVAAKLRGRG
ncbi:MAG: extracellular solute-binding protein [Oscillospiraceae bacterium]|jgi:multiple sugar transport system substrate-binding protein|nr:extracellular solute-binding protein [Oscillospiraceae bacterium]